MPRGQCNGHSFGRRHLFRAGNMPDSFDRSCRKSIPPVRPLSERCCHARLQISLFANGRVVPQPRVQPKNLVHKLHQLIDSRIENAVLHGRKQTETVRRILKCSTDRPRRRIQLRAKVNLQSVAKLQMLPAIFPDQPTECPSVNRHCIGKPSRAEAAGTIRDCRWAASEYPSREKINANCTCCNCNARSRANSVFKCCRAPANGCRRAAASASKRARCSPLRLRKQLLIEFVPIFGDHRQQRRQRYRRIVRLRTAPGRPRCHQNRSRQYRAGLEQQLLSWHIRHLLNSRQAPRPTCIVESQTAGNVFIIDQVLVPRAEMIIRPPIHRMVKIVGPRIRAPIHPARPFQTTPIPTNPHPSRAKSPASVRSTPDTSPVATPAPATYIGIGRTRSWTYGSCFRVSNTGTGR